MRGTRFEVSSVGLDPALQLVGNDLDCSPYNVGIRIPTVRPLTATNCGGERYVFMLARAAIKYNQKTRLVGLRQLVTMRADVVNGGCTYPLERAITSPFWHFVDGSVSWHLRRLDPGEDLPLVGTGGDTFGVIGAQTPAIIGTNLTGVDSPISYVPPAAIPGTSVLGDLGTFYGIRWPWNESQSQFSMDYEIEGPCDLALFATVRQSDPATRCTLVPGALPAGSSSIPLEDAFVVNYPTAIYGRIAGAIILEELGANPCP